MAEESFQEKTEQATPRRRDEARRKGQVARSQELNSSVVLLSALIGLHFMGGTVLQRLMAFMTRILSEGPSIDVSPASFPLYVVDWSRAYFFSVFPVILVVGAAGLAISLGQVGFMINEEALQPKFSRLNPLPGLKRLVSKRSLFELVKGILKIGIVGYVSYLTIAPEMSMVSQLADVSISDTFEYIGIMMFRVGLNTALVLLVLAIIDYAYQRWEWQNGIKMTKQEVKEESKQTEGDPQVRSRVRSLQRDMARRRMMDQVPEADVVITNPTHYAIAVKYDLEAMAAPMVIAKGQNLIAQRIKELALEAGIPLVENKPLAQTLFKAVEVGGEIPQDLYRAVAEVLAYVYRLKGRSMAN